MHTLTEGPVRLESNRVWRTYLGGALIDRWQGGEGRDGHCPEEWVASTVEAVNPQPKAGEGLSAFLDERGNRRLLRDLIAADPQGALGREHTARHRDMDVLIKMLDSAERLAIQVHPDDETARRLFDSRNGKTESWYIADTRPPAADGQEPYVLLGFRPGVTRAHWMDVFHRQDIPAMVECLHRFPVRPGELYYIPGGVPHAIGGGCFIMEIQQPTDLTVRTERATPSGLQIPDRSCHQGIGFEAMFDLFRYEGLSREETLLRLRIPPRPLPGGDCARTRIVGEPDTAYFSVDRLDIRQAAAMETGDRYQVLIVYRGDCELRWRGQALSLPQSSQVFVPARTGSYSLHALQGDVQVLVCGGPRP